MNTLLKGQHQFWSRRLYKYGNNPRWRFNGKRMEMDRIAVLCLCFMMHAMALLATRTIRKRTKLIFPTQKWNPASFIAPTTQEASKENKASMETLGQEIESLLIISISWPKTSRIVSVPGPSINFFLTQKQFKS